MEHLLLQLGIDLAKIGNGALGAIIAGVVLTLLTFSASATAGLAWEIRKMVRQHDRVLYGDEKNESWNGVLGKLSEHENRIQTNAERSKKNKRRVDRVEEDN